ncbi:MAG: hypothetical protein WDN04_13765 [Rhodospirillales bacterium]
MPKRRFDQAADGGAGGDRRPIRVRRPGSHRTSGAAAPRNCARAGASAP